MSDADSDGMDVSDGDFVSGSEEAVSDEEWKEMKPVFAEQRSFQVMAKNDVIRHSKELIEGVRELLSLSSSAAAAALLRHFKWNRERLLEAYMSNPEKTLKEIGMGSLALEVPPPSRPFVFNCAVCLQEVAMPETFALGCGHRYCKACWADFLEVHVAMGPNCVYTQCMHPGCSELCHEECFEKMLDPRLSERYKDFLHRSFIDHNPNVKWCPRPGCDNSVSCDRRGRRQPVLCACGFSFCFQCADYEIGNHLPASCSSVKAWNEKSKDESENVKWLDAHTKRCPKCQKHIEKNGGCMHMTCRKDGGGCDYQFCWLCRGPWAEHGSATGGYYACLSDEMQILTSDGFLFLEEARARFAAGTLSVASLVSESGELVYEQPSHFVVNPYDANQTLVSFASHEDDLDMVVTRDHKMLVRLGQWNDNSFSGGSESWTLVPAEQLVASSRDSPDFGFEFRAAPPMGLASAKEASLAVLRSVLGGVGNSSVELDSSERRDELVRLALHCGLTASVSGMRVTVAFDKETVACRGVDVTSLVSYLGRTWCVTMPHGLIVTRRCVQGRVSRPYFVGNCNKYDASTAKNEDLKADQVKTELDEYMFFYHRFSAHRSALGVAAKQLVDSEERGVRLQKKFEVRSQDTKFLQEACAAMQEERRVLMWSYCQGYWLKREGEKGAKEYSLFEHLQEQVEKYCDALSGLYERPEDSLKDYHQFYAWKQEVINITNVCERQLKNFISGVGDGLTEERF